MPEQFPPVSVIVAVRNAQFTLEACVGSLLNLAYPGERELIFVDNGSTDGSLSVLRSFGGAIRVVGESKRGASAARNRGVREARFSIVAFTDSDCAADPEWLRHLVVPLPESGIGAAGGAILSRRPCSAVEEFGETIHDNGKAIEFYQPPYIDSANLTCRKEVLQALGGFDESFLRAQDCELSCRMLQAGYRFAYASRAIVYHRNESTYAGLFREGYTHGRNNVPLIERHRAFYESFGYRPRRLESYRQLWRRSRQCLAGRGGTPDRCSLAFNAGKRIGRLAGSLKCGRLHL